MQNLVAKLAETARNPWYPVACVGLGVVVGVVADRVYFAVKGQIKSPSKEAVKIGADEMNRLESDIFGDRTQDSTDADAAEDDSEKPQVSENFEKPSMNEIIDYTKYAKKNYKEILKEDDGEAMKSLEVPPMSMIDVISEEDFVKARGNNDGFVTVVGTWFPEERILAGWNDDLMEKPAAENIGDEAVRLLDDGAPAVYVRNRLNSVLYEIISSQSSWEDAMEDAQTLKEEG